MPSRSIRNATRGNQIGPKAEGNGGDKGPPDAVDAHDGRANTNAGAYERHADGETPPDGRVLRYDTQ